MTASLRLPSLARLVDELDGSYPGLSLLEIVTGRMHWTMRSVGMDDTTTKWRFDGKGRCPPDELLAGTFMLETFRNHEEKGGLAYSSSVEIRLAEGRTRHFVIKVRSGDSFGESLTRISVVGEEFDFPIVGYPHWYKKSGKIQKLMNMYIGPFQLPKDLSFLLDGITDGKIFLAPLALEMYTEFGDLTADINFASFSLEDFSKRLEGKIRRTGWGD